MRKDDAAVLRAYMGMILDGTAFRGWGMIPDISLRRKIVDYMMDGKSFHNELARMKKAVFHSDSHKEAEIALRRLIGDMEIKEEEFMV